jgi:alpha-beta hydrolase superfamily lysophospholipase
MAAIPGLTVKDEVIDDALAAVTLLRGTPKIDKARLFVLGHSLGGTLAPRIGAADPAIRGLILMAGAVGTIQHAVVEQTRYMANLDGQVSPQEQQQIDEAVMLAATIDGLTATDKTSSRMYLGAPASYWLDLRGYDPASAAKSLKQAMLVLQGERDYQVTMTDFGKWRTALAGRTDVTFHSYPALNHLFIAGTGPANPNEYATAGHVSEPVIRDIAMWIQSQR